MHRDIRVYDREDTYRFTIRRENIDGDITYSISDTGMGPFNFTYTGSETINVSDVIVIHNSEDQLYKGYVISIAPNLSKRDTTYNVHCLGIQSILKYQLYLYPYEALNVDYSFTRSGVDAGTIVREAVEREPYLLDYERSNIFADINDYSTASWTRTGMTTGALLSPVTAPDGATIITTDRDFDTGSSTNGISQTIPAIDVDNKTYVVRAWVRSGGGGGNYDFRFELQAVGAVTNISTEFKVDENWRLFSYTAKFNATGTGGVKGAIIQTSPTLTQKLLIRGFECFDAESCSIDLFGSNVSIDFDSTDCLTTIEKVKEVTGYSTAYDGRGNVYFYDPAYLLSFGPNLKIQEEKYIQSIEYKKDISELVNKVYLKYSASTVTSEDSTSIDTYGLREIYIDKSAEITSGTTAQSRADTYIAKYKDPVEYIKVVVNRNYPSIDNLFPGTSVEIENDTLDIGIKVIVKVDITSDNVTIYLTSYESIQKSLLKLG